MIRQPTPLDEQLRWWREQLAGANHPIYEGDPKPGYYKTRAWSRGPFIPARIWLEQEIDFETGELADDEVLKAEIGNKPADAEEAWIWLAQRPITLKSYKYLQTQMKMLDLSGTRNTTYINV